MRLAGRGSRGARRTQGAPERDTHVRLGVIDYLNVVPVYDHLVRQRSHLELGCRASNWWRACQQR